MFISLQSVLSLFSTGRTTGLAVDLGDDFCHTLPIYEGHGLLYGIERLHFAGRHLTDFMRKMLVERGCVLRPEELDTVRAIKEKHCYVARDFKFEMADASAQEISYELLDGEVIKIGNERFRCPEALFDPSLAGIPRGTNGCGIQQCTHNSIQKSPDELRLKLYDNIVLCGGSSMFPGLGDRLQNEVSILNPDMGVNVTATTQPKYSAWLGGSILGSLPIFDKLCMTNDDYNEFGPMIVHRKFFV